MNKKQVLQENREYIIEEYKNGKDTVWLGKKFGVSNAYIYLFLRDECKIKMRVVQKFYSVKDKIMELYEGGAKSYNQIAKQIGVSNTTCMKYCKKLGIDFSHNDCQREVTLVSQLDEIVKDYESGMGCTKLSKKYDASEASINMFLRRHGIEAKYLKQYDIPHTFFDNIDCEEKAYVLGFFAADGCQTKNNRFQVSVTDEQILRDIYSVMKYDGPVGIRESYKDNWKEQYYFSIGSVYMCKRLTELGCPKRKSMILDMPKDEDLP
ncbi:hypothetical protein H8D36_06590, partial [archaeon]|nr:hypothetical protein [archaeon]